jgi:CheY-like chemotaxis protein
MTVFEAPISPTRDRRLAGLRVLIVEDELLVALETKSTIKDMGVTVLGPVPRIRSALDIVEKEPLDGALLDVNLGQRTTSYDIADALAARGIPFVFMTGYSRDILPPRFSARPVLSKPVVDTELAQAMLQAFIAGTESSERG